MINFIAASTFAATLAAWLAPTQGPPADPQWLPLPAQSLEIPAGSPLDFSGLVGPGPAGSRGPLQISADGVLRFKGVGDPARFNCGMLATSPGQSSFPSHVEADALAQQLRRHGYSLVRLHMTDIRLIRTGSAELALDPEQLDRFYYLLAALKREGIYWMVDVLSKGERGLSGAHWSIPSSVDDLRVRINLDPAARAKWLKFVDAVFARRNPYTGASILADPALAFVVGANENDIGFIAQLSGGTAFPAGFAERFDQWVRANFANPQALKNALPDLTAAEQAGTARIALPNGWRGTDARTRLMLRFASDLEVDTYGWMRGELRQRGFQGPLLANQVYYTAASNRSRARLPIIDVHAYVGEVTSFSPGAKLFMPSSTSDEGLGPWMLNASARWLDRPMVASEYGAAYPNPYRNESGLFFASLAAFQGYSTICRNASRPVETDIPGAGAREMLWPYGIGLDPVERANETLAALLFYRGDVSPAAHSVAVPFGPTEMDRPGSALLPREVSRAAMLARFGLIAPDKLATLPPGTQILPVGSTPYTLGEKALAQLNNWLTGSTQQRLQALVQSLRDKGVLNGANRTDPANGLYESDTNQLLLDQNRGRILIVTPRTEAVSVTAASGDIFLNQLRIQSVNGGALVAISSLDGAPIESSRRLLFILVGDARAKGLSLNGTDTRRTVSSWGTMPILMRRVQADVSLRSAATKAQLTTLSLNGVPIGQRTLPGVRDGALSFRLDTGAVAGAPTTYFLLER